MTWGSQSKADRSLTLLQSAMIDDGCVGCSVPAFNGSARRNLSHQRRMLPGCGCGIPMRGNRNAILALRRTATSSSGYDTFYSRHSPHLHCYMLRSIRDVPQAQANNPPENSGVRRDQQQKYDKNNGLESSQPQPSTLCTTDGRRPCPWTWRRASRTDLPARLYVFTFDFLFLCNV